MFHDDTNETRVGDEVIVTPSRPLSAKKKFTLVRVVRKA
jgi:small subunit ribosomal protein S17